MVLLFTAAGICRKCREHLVRSTETEIDDLPLAVKDLTLVSALTAVKMQVSSRAQIRSADFHFFKGYKGTAIMKDRIEK